jgi:hypothetical protein
MQEPGISKLVSVRFQQQAPVAAQMVLEEVAQ